MTIQNLQDHKVSANPALTILMAGPSGVGKSIGACSWPGPIYVACLDDRMTSVRNYYQGVRNDIDIEIFNNFDDLDDRIDKFEFECKYRTVIIDPVTFLSEMLMRYSFKLRGAGGGEGSKGRAKGVVDLTTVEDFGVEYQGITQLMASLKIAQARHGFNIIVIAHIIKTDYYKTGGIISHTTEQILTQGRKIAAKMPAMFDEVYYFYAVESNGETQFKIRTYNDGVFAARSSFPNVPKDILWTGSKNLYGAFSKFYGLVPNVNKEGGETK